MFERFTDRARKVMALANQEAQRLGHEYIGTEHMLAGLLLEGTGVGANVLKILGLGPERARQTVERLAGGAARAAPGQGKLPMEPRAKQAIEFAIEEARLLGHNYVGTEHLLLALTRDPEAPAAHALAAAGLSPAQVREEVLNLLGKGAGAAEAMKKVIGGLAGTEADVMHWMQQLQELVAAWALLTPETREEILRIVRKGRGGQA